MTGGSDRSSDGVPDPPPPGPDRPWQHPSEVGLAVRGRTDRRRSTLIATGVLLSGIGLLVSGIMLGSMRDEDQPAADDDGLADRIEASVANVMVMEDGTSSMVTGLVIDDDGHVLVQADELGDADELWARCHEGTMQPAAVVASDATSNLAVLKLETPAGRPPIMSGEVPRAGLAVLAVGATGGAVATHEGTIGRDDASTSTDMFHTDVGRAALTDGLVFDRDGALMGVAMGSGPSQDSTSSTLEADGSTVPVRTAGATMAIARQLVDHSD